ARATPSYASTLRLMVWVQSPPTIVNGEMIAQTVSMSKQQNLIASQLVLNNAIQNGELNKLESFKGSFAPIVGLKKMLRIVPVDKNADALDLTLTGSVAADLPTMLEEIVGAYIKVIEEDTVEAGKESISLIQSLQKRLEDGQKVDQTKYFDLLKKLNLTSENDSGKWTNPYTTDISRRKTERELLSKTLEDLDQKIKTLKSALEKDSAPLKQLLTIEARKSLLYSDEKNDAYFDKYVAEERSLLNRSNVRLEMAEIKILDMEAEREDKLKNFGPQHPGITSLDSMLQSLYKRKYEYQQEIDRITKTIESKQQKYRNEEGGIGVDLKIKESDLLAQYGLQMSLDHEKAKNQLAKLNAELDTLEEQSKLIASDMAEVNMLKEAINQRRDVVEKILDKLTAVNVMSNNYTTTKVRVIDPASAAIQVAPKLLTYLSFGTIVAGLLGIGLAILIDQSDLSYRTPIDIQHSLSVPVICKIPKIKSKKVLPGQTASPILVTAFNPQSPASETFRAARTALLFTANQTNGKVFLFTSPAPGDGKSTTSSNLAISLAQAKKKVVLVDADFRRPRVQQNFGIQIEPGCVEVLSGAKSLDEALRPCEFQTNLSILTSGGRPKDAGELIASTEFASMIAELRERFDIVIIDSPPILPVADSTSLASVVDGIFLVLRIRRGVMLAAHKAKERLDMVQAKVIGVIVNGMDENVYYNEYGMYYRGGYYSGYGKYYESQNSTYTEKSASEARRASRASKI
ncbi:MAG: polysaccharide biosynthesis tyrosine autokinase, partial [Pirellula sp.]